MNWSNKVSSNIAYRIYNPVNDLNKSVIFNNKTKRYVILDDLSSTIFEYFLSMTAEDFISFLYKNDLSEKDFDEFYLSLVDQGVFEVTNTTNDIKALSENEIDDIEAKKELEDLYSYLARNNLIFSFHIDVTNHCNERCIHCYHPFDEYANKKELTATEIKIVIEEVYNLGCFNIIISGGEALLKPDIFEIIEFAQKYHMMITLFTNGMMLNKECVESLSKLNISLLSFSLYGANAETHDTITTVKGSFEKTLAGIKRSRSCGINCEIKCVVLKQNYKELPLIKELANVIGCPVKFDFTLTGKINGELKPFEYSLSYEEYCLLVKEGYLDLPGAKDNPSSYCSSIGPCNAGRYGIYMDPYGDIYPCVSFRLLLGNYKNIRGFMQSDKLKKWNSIQKKDFKPCGKFDYCRFCIELCAGINLIENSDYLNCDSSMCVKAKAIHDYYCK